MYADDPTRHAAFLRRLDHEAAERQEDRADMLAYARRHGLTVRWEHSGFPGSELVPRLYRPGMLQPEPWPPGEQRR